MPKRSEESTVAAEHRTVSRVIGIIELVAANEPEGVRLGDLAMPIGAPKSSAHGLAKGLVAVGYLREQHERYFLGPAVLSLLGGKIQTFPIAYHEALQRLTDEWQETAFLATLVGDSSVYVDRVESPHFIRAAPPLNSRRPLWPRGPGKCFLAYMPARKAEAILRRTLSDTSALDAIKAELARIRDERYALNLSESEPDMIGIASPILSARGSAPTLAIAMGGPEVRMKPRLDEMIASIRETAAKLSEWT